MPLSRVDQLNLKEKLRQDIRDACKQLETFGEESLVILVCGDSVSSLGSFLGLQFLRGSSAVKTDFKKHCDRNHQSKHIDTNDLQGAAVIKVETSEHLVLVSDDAPAVTSPTCSNASDDDGQDITDNVDALCTDTKQNLSDRKSHKHKQETIVAADIKPNLNDSKSNKHKQETIVATDITVVKKSSDTPRRSSRMKARNTTPQSTNVGKENGKKDKRPALIISLKKDGVDNAKPVTVVNVPEVKSDVEIYLCHICNKLFSVRSEFKEHLNKHKELSCHICKTVFKTAEKRHAHKVIHQGKNEWHECDICQKAFKDKILLEEHILTAHENDKETQSQAYLDKLNAEINYLDNETNEEKRTTLNEIMSEAKPPYVCPICRKSFDKRMFNLRRHLLRHSTEALYPCRLCDRKFRSLENQRRHLVMHTVRKFTCEKCSRSYSTQELLDEHGKFVCAPDEKPYIPCDLCDLKSYSLLAYEKHQNHHSGIKAFKCEECGKCLATKESLGRHKIVQHTSETPWQCDVCFRKFKIRDTLRKHQKTHEDPKYHCEICQKGCTEWGNLKKHMLTHTKDKNFICDACGKAYGRKSLLDNHQRLHTGEKPFVCDTENCGKHFRSHANLQQHKSAHSSIKEHVCDICGKRFKTRGRMNHHRKFHTVDYRWPCVYCPAKFRSIFIYKNHLAKMHPEQKEEVAAKYNIRLYQCDQCHKMYGDKEDLTRHVYIHSGLKPFKCEYCGKAFNDKSNLRQHEKMHTGEKVNHCGKCYKSFIHLRSLKMHMKNVHSYTEVGGDDSIMLKIDNDDMAVNNCLTATTTQGAVPILCIQPLNDCGSQTSILSGPVGHELVMGDSEHEAAIRHIQVQQVELPCMEMDDPERQAVIQDIHGLQSEMQSSVLQELSRPLLLPMAMSSHSQLTMHTELTSIQPYPGHELVPSEATRLRIVENF